MELRTRGSWSGTASQLYSALGEMAAELKISTRQKAWPKNPKVFAKRLNELVTSLPAVGIEVKKRREGKQRTRIISINVVPDVLLVRHEEKADDKDDRDDILTYYSGDIDLQKRLELLVGTGRTVENFESGGPIAEGTLLKRLQMDRTVEWSLDLFNRVLRIAERDGRAFSPRPGFISFNG